MTLLNFFQSVFGSQYDEDEIFLEEHEKLTSSRVLDVLTELLEADLDVECLHLGLTLQLDGTDKPSPIINSFRYHVPKITLTENLRYLYSHLKVLKSTSEPRCVVPEVLRLLDWKQSTHTLYNNI